VVQELWNASIATSTRNVYQTGFHSFIQFLLISNIVSTIVFQDLNITEENLIFFIAHCYNNKLSHATIKLYLCGIRFMCLQLGIRYPDRHNLNRLVPILHDVKRSQVRTPKLRLPITSDILKKNCVFLTQYIFVCF